MTKIVDSLFDNNDKTVIRIINIYLVLNLCQTFYMHHPFNPQKKDISSATPFREPGRLNSFMETIQQVTGNS